jgi:hypothetical protein
LHRPGIHARVCEVELLLELRAGPGLVEAAVEGPRLERDAPDGSRQAQVAAEAVGVRDEAEPAAGAGRAGGGDQLAEEHLRGVLAELLVAHVHDAREALGRGEDEATPEGRHPLVELAPVRTKALVVLGDGLAGLVEQEAILGLAAVATEARRELHLGEPGQAPLEVVDAQAQLAPDAEPLVVEPRVLVEDGLVRHVGVELRPEDPDEWRHAGIGERPGGEDAQRVRAEPVIVDVQAQALPVHLELCAVVLRPGAEALEAHEGGVILAEEAHVEVLEIEEEGDVLVLAAHVVDLVEERGGVVVVPG